MLIFNSLFFVTVEYLQTYSYLFTSENTGPPFIKAHARRISEISISSNNSPIENLNLPNISSSECCLFHFKLDFIFFVHSPYSDAEMVGLEAY